MTLEYNPAQMQAFVDQLAALAGDASKGATYADAWVRESPQGHNGQAIPDLFFELLNMLGVDDAAGGGGAICATSFGPPASWMRCSADERCTNRSEMPCLRSNRPNWIDRLKNMPAVSWRPTRSFVPRSRIMTNRRSTAHVRNTAGISSSVAATSAAHVGLSSGIDVSLLDIHKHQFGS
ncbi:MAG: hypothetical protein FWF75_01100 [Propionibacteriaceae bacterium]|nr:hypothetical protein [Propionibacteriaceae bacterium]